MKFIYDSSSQYIDFDCINNKSFFLLCHKHEKLDLERIDDHEYLLNTLDEFVLI